VLWLFIPVTTVSHFVSATVLAWQAHDTECCLFA